MAALIAPTVATVASSLIDSKLPTPITVRLPGVNTRRSRRGRPRRGAQSAASSQGKRTRGKKKAKQSQRTGFVRGERASGALTSFGSARTDSGQLSAFRAMANLALGQMTGASVQSGLQNNSRFTRNTISFDHAHNAQRDVEKTFRNGIRVIISNIDGASGTGQGQFSICVAPGTGSAGRFAFQGPTAANVAAVLALSPNNVDDKLALLAKVFEFSACRYLKMRTMPNTTDFAAPYTVQSGDSDPRTTSVALGVLKNYDDINSGGVYAAPTFKQVCDLENFTENHNTKAGELEYYHFGTELWATNKVSVEDADFVDQAGVLAIFDANLRGASAASNATLISHTAIFAVWDFYGLRTSGTVSELVQPLPSFDKVDLGGCVDENPRKRRLQRIVTTYDAVDSKSFLSGKDEKTRYVSVSNDDVKSLFEESVDTRPPLKRSEPVPIPRPAITSTTPAGSEKKRS